MLLFATHASAEVFEYTVDPTRSALQGRSTVFLAGVPLDSFLQGENSNVAQYTGTVVVELTPTTIQMLSGTLLIAGNSGDWLPGTDFSQYPGDLDEPDGYTNSPAPANYGFITDLSPLGNVLGMGGLSPSSTRDLQMTLIDESAKPFACGAFDEGGTPTDFVSGTIYYSSGGSPPITDMINTISPDDTSSTDNDAWIGKDETAEVLTLPVYSLTKLFINFLVVELKYEGTIVATRDATGEFVPGDLNDDVRVDLLDFSEFRSCAAGRGNPVPLCECREADLDVDRDVDLLDFGRLQQYHGTP